MGSSYSVSQHIKKTGAQGSRFNKINNAYCIIKETLKWCWLCIFKGVVVKDTITASRVWGPALMVLRYPRFCPPSLLCHQIKYQHSKKGNNVSVPLWKQLWLHQHLERASEYPEGPQVTDFMGVLGVLESQEEGWRPRSASTGKAMYLPHLALSLIMINS